MGFAAISVVFAWAGKRVHEYRRQAVLIGELEMAGMHVLKEPGGPGCLRWCCEEGTFFDATAVWVSDPSVNDVWRLAALPRLRSVYIERSCVAPDDLSFLRACRSVTRVGFAGAALEPKTVEALATAAQLEMVILDSCGFEERSLEALSGLRHLRMLKIIDVDIKDDARERLLRSLPGVRVSVGGAIKRDRSNY